MQPAKDQPPPSAVSCPPASPGSGWRPRLASLLPGILALGLVLIGLQMAMLIGNRETLHHAHWRAKQIFGAVWPWLAAMLALWLASLLAIWRDGALSKGSSRRLCLAGLAVLLFLAFMTRLVFEQSYATLIIKGQLPFGDLLAFLFSDCFDRAPYWGAYVAVAGLGCGLAAKLSDRRWGTSLVWSVAVVYLAVFYLNLAIHPNYTWLLLGTVLLGLAGTAGWLPAAIPPPRALHLCLPFVVLAILGPLLIDHARPYSFLYGNLVFRSALVATAIGGGSMAVLQQRLGGKARATRLTWLMPAATLLLFQVLMRGCNAHYRPGNVVLWSIIWPTYLVPHLAMAVLLGLAVACLPVGPLLRRTTFHALALLLVLLHLIDLLAMLHLGARLDWGLLTFSNDFAKVATMAAAALSTGQAIALLAVPGGYLALALGAQWLWQQPARQRRLTTLGVRHGWLALAVGLLTLCRPLVAPPDKLAGTPVLRLLASAPLFAWRPGSQSWDELAANFAAIGMPLHLAPASEPPPPSEPLNVLLVILESSQNQHLSLFGADVETQPLLARYRDRMWLFPNFYMSFANSNQARFSIFSGLYPSVAYPTEVNPRIASPSLFEILAHYGYQNYYFYSSFSAYTNQGDYLKHRAFTEYYDATNMPATAEHRPLTWGVREEVTLRAMQDFLHTRANQQAPFFMTYVPAAPHHPYDFIDPRFKMFDDTLVRVSKDYRPAYWNSLLYVDWILAELLDTLDQGGLLDQTVVVITNDHGEMLGDTGRLGHGWLLTPQLSNIPLIILDPRRPGPRVSTTAGSQVDILATLLDLLGLPLPENQFTQGVSLAAAQPSPRRRIQIGSLEETVVVDADGFHRFARNGTPLASYHIAFDHLKTIFVKQETTASEADALAQLAGDSQRFWRLQGQLIRDFNRIQPTIPNLRWQGKVSRWPSAPLDPNAPATSDMPAAPPPANDNLAP